jgi:hypothetical protein
LTRVPAWKKPPRRTRVRDDRLLDCLWPLLDSPFLDSPLLDGPLLAFRLPEGPLRYWRGG